MELCIFDWTAVSPVPSDHPEWSCRTRLASGRPRSSRPGRTTRWSWLHTRRRRSPSVRTHAQRGHPPAVTTTQKLISTSPARGGLCQEEVLLTDGRTRSSASSSMVGVGEPSGGATRRELVLKTASSLPLLLTRFDGAPQTTQKDVKLVKCGFSQ